VISRGALVSSLASTPLKFLLLLTFHESDVRVKQSLADTSCFQKWKKYLLKKFTSGPFYMTPSHQIIEISK
jgi:uncharacterized membrane protein YbaN (DUF454 family)